MKENINEHDMTKKMMDIMRGGFKNLLKEDENNEYDRDYTMTIEPGSELFNQELAKFSKLDVDVTLTEFKIYPNQQNVKVTGVYLANNDATGNGLTFTFMRNMEDPTYEMKGVNLQPDFLDHFLGLFKTWKDEWIQLLATSYKPKVKNNG